MEIQLYKAKGLSALITFFVKRFQKKVSRSISILTGLMCVCFLGLSQTTSLTFSQIPLTDPDFTRPGGGAEQWNGQNTVNMPSASTSSQRLDAYYRFIWTQIQPYNASANSYDFSFFDSKINDAISKGQKFSFGIMQQCGGCDAQYQNVVGGSKTLLPLYLHNQMQSESVKDWSDGDTWIPNWNSSSYLTALNNLNAAINNHINTGSFNGVPYKNVIGYIDIRGYGDYGEWTNNEFSGPAGSTATSASLKAIIDAHVKQFPNFQLVCLIATYDHMVLGNTAIPADVGYYALTVSNNVGKLGWRRDNWGWTDNYITFWLEGNTGVYNGLVFKDEIMNRYKYAPIVGEPADLGQAGSFGDLVRQVQFYHANSFGNGNLDNKAGDATTQNNFRAGSKAAGYRLLLTGGSMTTTLSAGSPFSLSLNWQNLGAAPTYENWNVTYELRNSGNAVVWSGTSSFSPRLFLPAASASAINDNFTLPASVPQGTYSMYLIIKDPNAYRKPLPLAITGRGSDGSYLLRSNITVGTGGPVNQLPTSNAGNDQTIQLPTSTASLAGSGTDADGSIASYAWTKSSGPAGGTITTPAASNTTITGLAQGVYVFTLTTTDNQGGKGTDNVQITVNAAASNQLPTANAGTDQTIQLPASSVSVTGSGTDADGNIASYAWTKSSGPSGGTITTPAAANTTITGLAQGVYVFTLTTTDNSGGIGTDNVQITVNAAASNKLPSANAGADQTIKLPASSISVTGSGTDADGTISSYAWSKSSGPAGETITTPGAASTTITGLAQGVYVFTLTTTDNSGGKGTDNVQITVNAATANLTPVAKAGSDMNITMPTNTINVNGSGSTDPDGSITSYTWTKVGGPTQYTINSSSSMNTSVTNLSAGVYSFQLKVMDNAGAVAMDTVNVTVNAAAPANQPPVANAGADQTITLPINSVSISGGASSDPDGSISTYLWTKLSGPSQFTIGNTGTSSTIVNNLTSGVYSFQLRVTDNAGAIAQDTIKVIVNAAAVNQPPVANSGADISITLPTNTANLNGSASSDADGTISGYTWSEVSGPNTAAIAAAGSANTGISNLQQGVYTFALKVVDNIGASDLDSIRVTVNAAANQSPVANAGSSKSVTLPVSSASLDGSLSADPDGSIASYAWAQTAGPSAASITAGNTNIATATNLVAGIYTFELTVTDNSGASAKASVKITVVASGIQPPVANAGADQTITLPTSSVTISGSGSSASSGSIVSYVWAEKSGPSTVSLTNAVQNTLNNLQAGVYVFTLLVTDNNAATGKDSVIITVNPAANQAPIANAGSGINLTLPTNSVSLDGTKSSDPDGSISTYNWTRVSGPSNPTTSATNAATLSLSGLVVGQYTYQLTVTDNKGASASAQVKIIVSSATNVAPVANAGPNQSITAPANVANLNGTASTDSDGSITAFSWVTISGPGSVTINNSNTATPSVVGLQAGGYVFELTVTDNRGATSKDQISVTVLPAAILPNQLPVANAGNDQTIILPTTTASLDGRSSFDPDGTITGYGWKQISGPSASTITPGNKSTTTVSKLSAGQYIFELTVTDNNGKTTADRITVQVNAGAGKLNLPPVAVAGISDTIVWPTNSYTLDATQSMDPDGTINSYQWLETSGPNMSSSSMNSSKVSISNLSIGVYQFKLTVTDNSGASSTSTMTLTVSQGETQEFSQVSRLSVYPNPAHSIVNQKITSSITGTVQINIYNMSGKLVLTAQTEKTSDVLYNKIGVSQLAPGMYTIQVNIANQKTLVSKFIKY